MCQKMLAILFGVLALAGCSTRTKPSDCGPLTRCFPMPVLATGGTSATASGSGAGTSAPSAMVTAGMSGRPIASGSAGSTLRPAGQSAPPPTLGGAGQVAAQAGHPATAGTDAPPVSGDAGAKIANPAPKPSAGCGMPAPMSGMANIDVSGTSRAYIMTLPQNYDSTKPYKLIFAWHGLGGSAQQVATNWYGLSQRAQNSAIFVAGQGLETSNSVGSGPGWANSNGEDVAFVKALYAQLQTQLCFDQNRVFSVGMSYGGIMSITLGCSMGDVFRAIAPMSGAGPGYGGRATCVGQVAVWQSHGNMDTTVATAQGEASRDFWVEANHCQTQAVAVDPSPCVEYEGCDPDKPVTFCEFAGGHQIPSFAAAAIWTFFAQF
jgi:polyhydroxybutyrate depolymerase